MTIHDALRQHAYALQRTGNPRCEAEAMEIHGRLDGMPSDHMKEIIRVSEELGLYSDYMTLQQIVDQLKSCQYVCEAGPLENNQAFMALEKMAKSHLFLTVPDGLDTEAFRREMFIHEDSDMIAIGGSVPKPLVDALFEGVKEDGEQGE